MGSDGAREALGLVQTDLPRSLEEISADLDSFFQMLGKWQRVQNLVSRETLIQFWSRHVADSLQLLNYWSTGSVHVVDIGSGGGFPALPLAIARKESNDRFTLIESNGRKAVFLKAVIREFDLNAVVLDSRVESVQLPVPAAIVTARAVAALPRLLEMAEPICGPETRLLLHKGREYREEVKAADIDWRFDVIEHKSLTDPDAVVLELCGPAARKNSQ